MRQGKKKKAEEERFARYKEGRNSKCKRVLWKTWKRGITLYNTHPLPPSPLHPSSHVLSLRHWKQRFLGDKLKYFIGDVTDAYSYRVLSCFFRIHRRNKDRPRLYRHHGFGSVLRRAVSYQIINFLHRFTAFDSGSTALDNYRTPRSLQSRT